MLPIEKYSEILANKHLDEWQRTFFERRYKQAFLAHATATSVWCDPPQPWSSENATNAFKALVRRFTSDRMLH